MPERYFDVGIAEQQAILFAAGLALQGQSLRHLLDVPAASLRPDRHDVCLQKLQRRVRPDRAGLVGDDGPTHHGAFDIAYLRCLPNIVLMAPRDEAMLVNMLRHGPRLRRRPDRAALSAGQDGLGAARGGQAIAIGTGEILRSSARRRRRQPRGADRLWQRRGQALEPPRS